jgi:hypothetical protein
MKTSQTIGSISAAIAAAQIGMEAARFDSKNPHFNSKYASLASVMEAIKPLALKGVALTQACDVARDEKGSTLTVTTLLSHESGEWISSELSMRVERDTPQGIGSALTYARRYAVSAICGIAADDDDDGEKVEPRGPVPPKPPAKQAPKPAAPAPAPAAKAEQTREQKTAEAIKNLPAHNPNIPVTQCPTCKGGKNPTAALCPACDSKAESEARKAQAQAKAPEAPAPAPAEQEKRVDMQTLRRINGYMSALGLTTPEEKKDLAVMIVRHELALSAHMTETEGELVIAKLESMIAPNQQEAA